MLITHRFSLFNFEREKKQIFKKLLHLFSCLNTFWSKTMIKNASLSLKAGQQIHAIAEKVSRSNSNSWTHLIYTLFVSLAYHKASSSLHHLPTMELLEMSPMRIQVNTLHNFCPLRYSIHLQTKQLIFIRLDRFVPGFI